MADQAAERIEIPLDQQLNRRAVMHVGAVGPFQA